MHMQCCRLLLVLLQACEAQSSTVACVTTGQRQGMPMLPSIVGLPANGGAHPGAFVNPSSPAPNGALPPAVPNAGPAVSIQQDLLFPTIGVAKCVASSKSQPGVTKGAYRCSCVTELGVGRLQVMAIQQQAAAKQAAAAVPGLPQVSAGVATGGHRQQQSLQQQQPAGGAQPVAAVTATAPAAAQPPQA